MTSGERPLQSGLDRSAGNLASDPQSVDRLIDQSPVGWLQLRVFILCGLAIFSEGYDAQAIAYVAPALARDWGLSRAALGPTFAAGVVGLSLGALLIAPLADRIGRRPILLWSSFAFGLLTLATAAAPNLPTLLVLRLATGFGIGAAMACAIGLAAEYSPARRRGAAVASVLCGYGLGAASAGAVAAWLVGAQAWRLSFAIGGLATLLLGLAFVVWLPESLRFLALRGDQAEVTHLAPDLVALASAPPATTPRGSSFADLFREGRAAATTLLWALFFVSLLDLYLLNSWLPTAINAAGQPLRLAILASTLLQFGSVAGALALGPLMDRFGPFIILPLAYLAAAACIAAVGLCSQSVPLLLLSTFGAGVGVIGCQNCNHALLSGFYPTAMRAHGLGATHAVGRLGSIAGPLLGGVALGMGVDARVMIVSCAGPMLIAAACLVGLGGAVRPTRSFPG